MTENECETRYLTTTGYHTSLTEWVWIQGGPTGDKIYRYDFTGPSPGVPGSPVVGVPWIGPECENECVTHVVWIYTQCSVPVRNGGGYMCLDQTLFLIFIEPFPPMNRFY